MLNAKLKKTILDSLPKGITLKRDNALWVKKSKKFRHNGEDKEKTLTHSVRLGITPDMSDAKAIEQFEKSVAEAVRIRGQMVEKLSSKLFLHQETIVKLHCVGTLKQVFDSLDTRGTWKGKHQQLVRQYFTDTLNFFLEVKDEKEPKLSDIHNIFTLGDFKTWCLKQVENRKMNMRGTFNTNSVNKRLGVWRQITAEAIRMKLWNLSDCIDPSRKCFGIEDFARNKSKPKKPLSIEEEDRLLNTIKKDNDDFWYACSVVAIDSSTTYNTSSDYRLKENVSYDFDATTRLKKLKPARFNFKKDKDNTIDGFIAHEVSDIVPNAVNGAKDAVETYTDNDGKEQTRPLHQGIDHSKLVPLLVKTIQELEARIAKLESK